ncbi:hypothetical protein AAFF_G00235980 [Aldrovandia affinis]|uniref:Doublecortin domain-containing protein n=1 Tax=Aldrovandia affinis TaxID=143900 RepID=A0AAD7REE8_9TELE|nr:hypothetical protein AAFF_G00235980 [Aldrovandia affinis]
MSQLRALPQSPSPVTPHRARRVKMAARGGRPFRCFDTLLDDAPLSAPGYGHRRRVVLVRNSDPAVRRTVVLRLRELRSLRLLIEEISALLHCHVRALHALDGRKMDSVQSLAQCPSVLVCVGREPFHPVLLEKNSEEKLPTLPVASRSIVSAEGQESGNNVNFGLETKKSIIHPRSDSSARSARHSLSSEKSFPSRLNSTTPGNSGHDSASTCSSVKESTWMDNDVKKKVIVNKDGSLSVKMKVRFHLLKDETLQWSTEIKRAPGTFSDRDRYLQRGDSESCSEAESLSANEAEDAFLTELYQRHLEEPHCQHCCTHCQEHDIWKSRGAARLIRSSSSSASSRTITRKKSSVDRAHTASPSSEEVMEHVVEKTTRFRQTAGDGESVVEYRTVSRSEVRSLSATSKSRASTVEKHDSTDNNQTSDNEDTRPAAEDPSAPSKGPQTDQVSFKITQASEEDNRPLSTISDSSQILATLKEDLNDDEDDDLPPSVSRASSASRHNNQEDNRVKSAASNARSATVCKSPASSGHRLTPRPPSKTSVCSARSARSTKSNQTASRAPESPAGREECRVGSERPVEKNENNEARASSAASAKSNASAGSRKSSASNCKSCGRAITPQSVVSDNHGSETDEKVQEVAPACTPAAEEEAEGRAYSALSATSNSSARSRKSKVSKKNSSENGEEKMDDRPQSALSAKTTHL